MSATMLGSELSRRRTGVVERLKQEPSGWWTVFLGVLTLLLMAGGLVAGFSGAFARNTVGVGDLQIQVNNLAAQVQRLADAVNSGPRAADVVSISTQLTGLDARVRVIESEQAAERATINAQQATLDGISAASKAPLRR